MVVRLSRSELLALRDVLSGRTDEDRAAERRAFDGFLQGFVAETAERRALEARVRRRRLKNVLDEQSAAGVRRVARRVRGRLCGRVA